MSQHFLLSAELRNFSLRDILNMTEEDAMMFLAEHRWGSREQQICPQCGQIDSHYLRPKRKQWKCKGCEHCFSVTSGMVFDRMRWSYRDLLVALLLYISAAKGMPALQMCRLLGIQAKTAAAFEGKLKEVLVKQAERPLLKGIIHVDGGYFCGKPRKPRKRRKITSEEVIEKLNSRSTKKKRYGGMTRKNWEKKKNKRVVLTLRELDQNGEKAVKTIVCVAKSENEVDALAFIQRYVAKGSLIMSDENSAYSSGKLKELGYGHEAVKHSEEWVRDDGVHENQAESYFSRLRRMEYGTTHGMTPTYLMDYAQEMSWREDTRNQTMFERMADLLIRCNKNGISEWWRGYWQGKRRGREILIGDLFEIEDRLRT